MAPTAEGLFDLGRAAACVTPLAGSRKPERWIRCRLHDDDSSLLEVLDLSMLFDPFEAQVLGRLHAGEELQGPQGWPKARCHARMSPPQRNMPQSIVMGGSDGWK